MLRPEIPNDYYLSNFRRLLEFVFNHYRSLLNPSEVSFYRKFYLLDTHAQMLLVRMLSRKGNYYRLDKFKYKEIANIPAAASQLVEYQFSSWVDFNVSSDWIGLFTKAEIIKYTSLSKQLPRADLEEVFVAQINETGIPAWFTQHCVIGVIREVFDVYRILFFGNLNRDLNEFVLQDLGINRYENYLIDSNNLPIQSREEISAIKECYRLSEWIHGQTTWSQEAVLELFQQIPPSVSGSRIVKKRRCRLVLKCAKLLERFGEFELAEKCYANCDLIPAKERQIRCLHKLQKYSEAWKLLQQLKITSSSQEEQQFTKRFEPKLAKLLGQTCDRKKSYLPDEKMLKLPNRNQPVELAVVEHFSSRKVKSYWVENGLFTTLFGLTYWNALFAPIKGAFYHPFQNAPQDIDLSEFIPMRQSIIDSIDQLISDDDTFIEYLKSQFRAKQGLACRFCNWMLVDNVLLEQTLHYVPPSDLRLIIKTILSDRKEFRAGMPDLICFDDEDGYRLVEVKGPGDKLQNNQLIWMGLYQQFDIPHQVVRVEWI